MRFYLHYSLGMCLLLSLTGSLKSFARDVITDNSVLMKISNLKANHSARYYVAYYKQGNLNQVQLNNQTDAEELFIDNIADVVDVELFAVDKKSENCVYRKKLNFLQAQLSDAQFASSPTSGEPIVSFKKVGRNKIDQKNFKEVSMISAVTTWLAIQNNMPLFITVFALLIGISFAKRFNFLLSKVN
jgi:hypothetical protein